MVIKRKAKNKSKKVAKIKSISKKITFSELMEKYPEAAEILMNKGMHCIGCGMAMFETLEQGAMVHGLDADELVNEINKKLQKTKVK